MQVSRMKMVIIAVALMGAGGLAYAAGDVAAGQKKAEGCAGCHGANGEGNGPNPALAGMAPEQFAKAIADYKSGARKHAVMKALASKLSPQDTENLGAYYASLKK